MALESSRYKFSFQHVLLAVTLVFPLFGKAQAKRDNFVNRAISWSYRIVQGDSAHPRKNYYFPVPILAYRPETRWVGGLSLTYLFRLRNGDSITRPTTVRLNTSYSQNNQFSIRQMFDFFTPGNLFNIRGQYQYTNFAEYFYGIGADSRAANRELYRFDMNRVNLKAAYRFLPALYAGIQINVEQMYNMEYIDNSRLLAGNIAGNRGSLSSGAGFTLYLDDRNNIYFPTRGQYLEISNCFYTAMLGSNFNFVNVSLDARKYIRLWKENVLAVQLVGMMNNGNIPFRLLGTLGSDSYMRGYYSGRYRDQNAMAFQTELRKHVWGPFGCVAFGGFGTVSPDLSGLVTRLKANYGVGLRIMAIPREKMNIRLDYGFGVDGNEAAYITVGEAF